MSKKISMLIMLVVLVVVGICFPNYSQSAVYDIPVLSSGDAVYSMYRDRYGADYSWSVNANPNGSSYYFDYFSGYGSIASWGKAFLQFDLSSIGASESIVAASLNINLLSNGGASDEAINILHASNASGANGNATQGIAGDALVGNLLGKPLGWNSFDVKDMISADVLAGYDWSAFSTEFQKGAAYYTSFGLEFGSAEGQSPAYLHIVTGSASAVPEPSTFLLLGVGLAGAALVRRKLKR